MARFPSWWCMRAEAGGARSPPRSAAGPVGAWRPVPRSPAPGPAARRPAARPPRGRTGVARRDQHLRRRDWPQAEEVAAAGRVPRWTPAPRPRGGRAAGRRAAGPGAGDRGTGRHAPTGPAADRGGDLAPPASARIHHQEGKRAMTAYYTATVAALASKVLSL